ncbi:MAG TPA: alpha/beta fold hydrolase [Tepidisphaeraceae bacterium]|nr:alpha/beta fold hydrolase [Tepidisphaeraceae bacterium]
MKIEVIVATILFALSAIPRAKGQMADQTFGSAGVKISYIEAGKGEPVILVHGLYSSAQMNWTAPGTFKQLAEHFHVIALDLRGHGNSGKPTSEDAYGQPMVEDIVRLMDHLKIQKAHIVGYSLGGIIVMNFMTRHPDRVISGTLGGMGWLRPGSIQQTAFERTAGREAGRTPPACVHGIGKLAVSQTDVTNIQLPVEILIGDQDPCKRLYVEPLERIRHDWPVIEIADAGHINCIVKAQFKDELTKWLIKNSK